MGFDARSKLQFNVKRKVLTNKETPKETEDMASGSSNIASSP